MSLKSLEGDNRKGQSSVVVRDWECMLLSDIGTKSQRVCSGSLEEISQIQGGWVHTLIIPAEMSDNEREAFGRRRTM